MRQKGHICDVFVILVFLLSVSTITKATESKDDFNRCEHIVKQWASSSLDLEVKDDKHVFQNLLFFLHVPRTGGRTYFHCFLKKLYASSLECSRSYDKLRIDPSTISTLDIWPWKHLVPWMREDLFARSEARKQNGHSIVISTNPYDMKEIVMPLHEYINNPVAQDILHNGATFQVAGLTNNSYLTEAHDVRHCVLKYQSLGDYVLKVAKKRLDDMLYVGLRENHKESATMFANVVGTQAISKFTGSGFHEDHAAKNHSEQSSSILKSDFGTTYHQSNSSYQKAYQISSTEQGEATKENMTAGRLMDEYESCISNLRKTQAERRVTSLKKIYPANFTSEGRRQVSEALLQEITSLNHLDVEPYKYNQLDTGFDDSYTAFSWEATSASVSMLFVIVFVLFATAKRRTSKLKL
ncbi:unnamed protein product [Withania somnifera]